MIVKGERPEIQRGGPTKVHTHELVSRTYTYTHYILSKLEMEDLSYSVEAPPRCTPRYGEPVENNIMKNK